MDRHNTETSEDRGDPAPVIDPFSSHSLLRNGHAQTLAALAWPRRLPTALDEPRLFEVGPDARILARCRWHEDRTSRATLILVHGLGGSCDSPYVRGAAHLAYRAGANVVRLNQRNCGGTEHLTPTLYHSGMSGDLATVIRELAEHDGLADILVAGFSMGGNLALKMAGEMGEAAPPELTGVCAVSPALDLDATVRKLELPSNHLYQRYFVRSFWRLLKNKKEIYPNLYDLRNLELLRTVRDFDELYTAPHGGFAGAEDYYNRASAIRCVSQVRVPTLVIHAQDDPFVPVGPLRQPGISNNPNVTIVTPSRGGHVAFISSKKEKRFWAEENIVGFLGQLSEPAPSLNSS